MTNAFNPEEFANYEVEGEMSTQLVPVPEGEHRAVIEDIKPRQINQKDGGVGTVLDIHWLVDNPQLEEEMGRPPKVRQTLFLDTTSEGGLDRGKGKNVGLGRLREAVGQNGPKPWKPAMLVGCAATVKVAHKPSDDGTKVYDNVVAVAPL